eukprot:CAMPEP_0204566718 /NCGR_PEP_ID=MMETSP0661-20131031/36204_1 /ASSEMBLY_ACC=CAM_ASM_000606 /TAXON_ID=109239 /ORGANISM="Alexandrium margalefi, Strain AMGDE01CS-322" /LENGTH=76 /DNA_ID=CAMNT_0051574579 /DNA_START=67 /DNA_END=294 /DNA_ORIENTATION=-
MRSGPTANGESAAAARRRSVHAARPQSRPSARTRDEQSLPGCASTCGLGAWHGAAPPVKPGVHGKAEGTVQPGRKT